MTDTLLPMSMNYNDGVPNIKFATKRQGCLSKYCTEIFATYESRSIMYFLLINFSFAFVELLWGFWTNSLGLITDSFHMFFDCSALVAGLIASVLARRPPNERFTYGYGRAQVIGGFVNGLFLIFVALFVLTEAIERFTEPPEVLHEHHLLEVSVLGLLVNFVGIFAFSHAHTHGGEPCDHGHAAGPPAPANGGDHGHGSHSHGHGNGGECCHGHGEAPAPAKSAAGGAIKGAERSFVLDGVLLHVIADTLGSVSVIISSLLIKNYGWMIADPVCSIFTALLILVSVYPLLVSSSNVLMQRTPDKLQPFLQGCYQTINAMNGVALFREPHFWSLGGSDWHGTIVLVLEPQADAEAIRQAANQMFVDVGVNKMIIQTERTR